MFHALASAAATWSAWYSDSAPLRTAIGFVHVSGLLIGGGAAVVEDRAVLSIDRSDLAAQQRQLGRHPGAHHVVLAGLVAVFASGALMVAADPGTYFHARVFWIKMAFVVALLLNGALMTRTWRTLIPRDASRWMRLRREALTSLTLWILATLLGAALPNV